MYLCKIIISDIRYYPNCKSPLNMKNKALLILTLFVLAITATSCYSSRKNGCPGNPQANYRFRG